ncbi:zinc ribbon domain-containing protein [Natranaerofaba carboxydovora]|uniref:zinc ribbon domain-containing protein n=1 Tax=Natranaerofaba carboxydovora TaxID=2742683 RepID=UPI003B845E76
MIFGLKKNSKICNKCERFGDRKGDLFKCKCGEYYADINAAINIKKRKFDSEIGLYTPYKQVEKTLEKRIKEVV